jgi:pSer/pThr/pTyr-binding forkhead associated (FHA) protein
MARSPFADFVARYDSGEKIFSAGDPGHTLFVVQSGAVELFASGGDDSEILAVMEKGDFFGEMSLLEGSPRGFGARAVEPTEVIEISPALFDRMIRSNIELAVRMLRKLSIRLSAADARLSARAREEPESIAVPPTPTPPPPGEEGPAPETAPPPEPRASPPAARVEGSSTTAFLVNPDGPEVFPVDGPNTHVGRFDPVTGTRPEVDLTLLDLKRSVSRRHAVLVADDAGFCLAEEVGALNGTVVNGVRLSSGEPVRIQDGDQIAFGGVTLRFQTSAP